MKKCFGLLMAGGVSLLIGGTASASIVAQYNFDNQGQPEGWTVANGTRQVAGDGVLRVLNPTANDPMVNRAIADQVTRATGENWTTFEVFSRELDQVGGSPIAFDPTGTVLIFAGANQGTPDSVGLADANGFQLLTWDISDVVSATSGAIRFDFFGGPGTSDAPSNAGEVDFIRISDSFVPEPASLALVGLGGLAMLGRRRK